MCGCECVRVGGVVRGWVVECVGVGGCLGGPWKNLHSVLNNLEGL